MTGATTTLLTAMDPYPSVLVTPGAATLTLAGTAPAVALGSLTLTPGAAPLTLAAPAPAVIQGSQVVTPGAATLALAAVSPAVVLGSVVVVGGGAALELGTTAGEIVLGALLVDPPAAVVRLGTVSPTVVQGSVAVTPGAAAAALGGSGPVVTLGSLLLTPGAVVLELGATDPLVTPVAGLAIAPGAAVLRLAAALGFARWWTTLAILRNPDRELDVALDAEGAPVVAMIDGEQDPEDEDEGAEGFDYTTRVALEIMIAERGASAATTLALAYAQLVGGVQRDFTLGGAVDDVVELETAFDVARGSYRGAVSTALITLELRWFDGIGFADRETALETLRAVLGAAPPAAALPVRERCMRRLVALVEGATPAPVERNADRECDLAIAPVHVIVLDGGHSRLEANTGVAHYVTRPRLEIVGTAGTHGELAAVAHAEYARIKAAVLDGERRLGGVAIDVVEREAEPLLNRRDYSAPAFCFGLQLDVRFATNESDPGLPAAA